MPRGRVLTHAVLVYRTFEISGEGRALSRRGRCYPLGELDPAMERAMLDDALYDAKRARSAGG
ncbi:hypothetical protein ACOBQX_19745 [Actinokineospora sp. G85]|uniref:hypothetical protein n=1 Tax=Actinokineospora sp. G85 TaxID=3406626 RepID=UPI003C73921C